MAFKFFAGMTNFVEVLNQMWDAFAVGPFNALPLIGGVLTGPLASPLVTGTGETNASSRPRSVLGYPGGQEPSISMARWTGQGNNDYVWTFVNSNGTLRLQFSKVGAFGTAEQESAYMQIFSISHTDTVDGDDITTTCNFRGKYLIPRLDNQYDIGLPSQAYRTIYARTGTINTSDARLKCQFRDLTPAEIAAACDLARAVQIYRWRDAVDEKSSDAREHIGPTVQRAIEIMAAHGLDPFNYGFVCYDAWDRQVVDYPAVEARAAVPPSDEVAAVLDGAGNVVTPAVPATPGWPAVEAREAYTEVVREAGDRYAFRYAELSMFIAAGQAARQDALEQRLAALEAA